MSLIAAGLVQAAGWRYTGQRVLLCCVVFMFRALWREGYETKDTPLFVFRSTLFLVNYNVDNKEPAESGLFWRLQALAQYGIPEYAA